MRRATQGLLLAFTGAVMIRLAISDAYLRYVAEWMRWPILVAGLLLIAFAVGPILSSRQAEPDHHDHDGEHADGADDGADDGHGHGHGVPRVTWLLVLPGLIAFVISPPALGSYLAERRANEAPPPAASSFAALPAGNKVPLEVQEFVWRALDGDTLVDRSVAMTGFVSYGEDGEWFVTRMTIGCCAADAAAYRAQVEGLPAPARDSWVTVVGQWVPDSGRKATDTPAVTAESVTPAQEPRQTYE